MAEQKAKTNGLMIEEPKPVKWMLPKEDLEGLTPEPYDDVVFEITPSNFDDELTALYMESKGFGEMDQWKSNKIFHHVHSISRNGQSLTKPADIVKFIKRMEKQRGLMLAAAVNRNQGFLQRGTVKNR